MSNWVSNATQVRENIIIILIIIFREEAMEQKITKKKINK